MLGVLRETLSLHDIPYVDDLGFTEEEQRMRDAVLSFLSLTLEPTNTLLMRKFLMSVTNDVTLVNEVMLKYIRLEDSSMNPITRVFHAGRTAGRNLELKLSKELEDLWEGYYKCKYEVRDLNTSLRDVITTSADIHVPSVVTDSIFAVVEDFYYSGEPMEKLSDVLSRLSLKGTDTHTMDKDAEAVKFMTMHKSKGLEFPVVFVVDVSNGHFPNKRSKGVLADEEMRLAYVAVTRAENKLYLLSSGDKYTARLSKSPSLPITVLCKADGTVKGGLTFAGDEKSFAKAVVEVMESNKIEFDKALNW